MVILKFFSLPSRLYETPKALDRICEEYNRVIGNMELEPLIAVPGFHPPISYVSIPLMMERR